MWKCNCRVQWQYHNNDDKGFEKKLSEYAVRLEKDLKDTLLWCHVDSDDSSKEQTRTVPNVVDEWDT